MFHQMLVLPRLLVVCCYIRVRHDISFGHPLTFFPFLV